MFVNQNVEFCEGIGCFLTPAFNLDQFLDDDSAMIFFLEAFCKIT